MDSAVQLLGVCKRFQAGAPAALDHLTLDVREGEFLFLLGPSGSGKTTALRLIGGYEAPDAGTVVLGGVVANDVPAHRRSVGMVFQNYALFPHMTVAQNVAFGLRMRGASRHEQAEQVTWALDLVRLSGLEQRYPRELSGGQQQRVALARALAFRPSLLLLDEPLANLDRHLRDEMRLELKALQRRLGLTTVFVTHDQEEALAMADRIAVLDGGRLEQTGAPAALYNRPRTGFVARFMGEMNLLPATLDGPDPSVPGAHHVSALGATLTALPPEGVRRGQQVCVCLRAERLQLAALEDDAPLPPPHTSWPAEVQLVTYLGASTLYLVRLWNRQAEAPSGAFWQAADAQRSFISDTGPTLRVVEPNAGEAPSWEAGDRVRVRWTGGVALCLPAPAAEAGD